MYDVYMRSMSVYTDHYLRHLQYENVLKINYKIKSFCSYKEAEEYLMRRGNEITKEFMEEKEQPCVFNIIKEENNDYYTEELDNKFDLQIIPKYPTFAFNEEAYKMILNEQYIFVSRDWDYDIPKHYVYVKEDNIKYGITKEHFEKVNNSVGYCEEDKEKLNKEFDEYDKLSNKSKRELFMKLCN
jgi:hypothetical protein